MTSSFFCFSPPALTPCPWLPWYRPMLLVSPARRTSWAMVLQAPAIEEMTSRRSAGGVTGGLPASWISTELK